MRKQSSGEDVMQSSLIEGEMSREHQFFDIEHFNCRQVIGWPILPTLLWAADAFVHSGELSVATQHVWHQKKALLFVYCALQVLRRVLHQKKIRRYVRIS